MADHVGRDEIVAAFAHGMRRRRQSMGLTQGQLGSLVGRHVSQISNIENGRHRPILADAVLIARALDTTVEGLLAGDQDASR